MTLKVESNITQVIANIRARANAMQSEYTASVSTNVDYAPAVEFGYEQEVIWDDLPKKQQIAIILAQEERKKSGKRRRRNKRVTVTKSDGGWSISVEGAGMVAKSIPVVAKYGETAINRLPKGFADIHAQQFIADVAYFALAQIAFNTPVDTGRLVGSWQVNL